jgi:hypothetical protein
MNCNKAKSYWPSRVSLHRFSLFLFENFILFFLLYYFTTLKVLPQGCVDPLVTVDGQTVNSQAHKECQNHSDVP